MSQYTYILHTVREESPATFYKRNELEKMTTFHLQEICRKERLVVPSHQRMDKEAEHAGSKKRQSFLSLAFLSDKQ